MAIPALASDGADAVKAKLAELQATYTTPTAVKAISDALSWLNVPANAATISSEQGGVIVSNINNAVAAAGDVKTLGELDDAQLNAVLANVNMAVNSLGWSITIDTSGGGTSWTVLDSDGKEVTAVSAGNVIKQTGIETTVLIGLIIGITLLFGGAVVAAIVTRKKMPVNEAV